MVKKINQNPNLVPTKYLLGINDGKNTIVEQLISLMQKNNIKGDIAWKKLKQLNSGLEKSVRDLVEKNTTEINQTYTVYGANKQLSKKNRMMKKSTIKKTTYKVKSLEQKIKDSKELLNEPINNLKAQQILSIISYSDLEHDEMKDYYLRLKELQLKPKYTVKPNFINEAKKLLTSNFGIRPVPLKWKDNDEIIKSKLYSAKMAIQYLDKTDQITLNETMKIVKPKLDEVLKALGYNDINNITF